MSNPLPPPKDTPKVDAIHRALRIFTLEQFVILLDECEAISAHGFGKVIIEFDHHHAQKVEQRRNRLLPKPREGDR